MNEKMMRFLLTAAFCVLTVLTVNAEATTADDQVCQANEDHVCFTKQADGSLAEIVTNGRGRAITREEDCEDTEVAVFYGCQPLSAIRAEEREECGDLGGRWYWCSSCSHGTGRCNESRPRDEDDSPPPTPPPQNPPPYTPPTPPGSGPGVTSPPGGGSIPPPLCPAACPDCNCPVPPVGPDPCADVDGLAAELAPLEQVSRDSWLVRADTDIVRSRVFYIRERAAECAEDGLYADAERVLAAMTPPETVTLPPDHPQYADTDEEPGDWCSENPVACGFLIAGAILAGGAVVTTGILLGTDYHISSENF